MKVRKFQREKVREKLERIWKMVDLLRSENVTNETNNPFHNIWKGIYTSPSLMGFDLSLTWVRAWFLLGFTP